jgi:putative ABC transport system permease protein
MADITVEGTVTFGASIAAALLVHHVDPWLATATALLGGFLAGGVTGILYTRFKINALLSGILVMTALYSVNLHVLGKSNVALLTETTLATRAEALGRGALGVESLAFFGREVGSRDLSILVLALVFVTLLALLLFVFLKTDLGTALRAAGDNPAMVRALGVDLDNMLVFGLALSNGLVAVAGALLSQYQGFADVQMGIGMVVWGLASVILGQTLIGSDSVGLSLVGAVLGSVLFRLLVAIALRWGLNPNDLKLVTALFVLAALVLPPLLARRRKAAA